MYALSPLKGPMKVISIEVLILLLMPISTKMWSFEKTILKISLSFFLHRDGVTEGILDTKM